MSLRLCDSKTVAHWAIAQLEFGLAIELQRGLPLPKEDHSKHELSSFKQSPFECVDAWFGMLTTFRIECGIEAEFWGWLWERMNRIRGKDTHTTAHTRSIDHRSHPRPPTLAVFTPQTRPSYVHISHKNEYEDADVYIHVLFTPSYSVGSALE